MMWKPALSLVAFTAVALPAELPAQGLGNVRTLATLSGTCERFTMAGRDLSANCNGTVLNPSYADGRTSFMFTMADGSIVSFYGRDTKAAGGKAALLVEKVTIKDGGDAGSPAGSAARGRCDYTNPYAGRSVISCTATAMGQSFSARFVSDGRPPSVTRN